MKMISQQIPLEETTFIINLLTKSQPKDPKRGPNFQTQLKNKRKVDLKLN